jgi:Tfp pilus assembly protein PilN
MRAVNLIPPERRAGASVGLGRSHGGAYGVLALVGALALLVLLYGSARHQIKSKQVQAQKLTAEAAQAQNEAGALGRYNGLIAESEVRTQAVEQLVDTRFDWAHVFHELGRVLPKQVSIASLTGTVGSEKGSAAKVSSGSGISSVTPPGSVPIFILTGCAGSQTVVAQMLARLRLVEGVQEATLQSSVSSASGTSSGAGTCPGSDPIFSVAITFEPLPAATPKATATVSDTAGSSK